MGGDRRALRAVSFRRQRRRVKLSQEIQPTWDAINWEYGQNLWVQVDTQHKRILVGVPMGSATQPNQILMLDYTEGFGDPLSPCSPRPNARANGRRG